MLALVWGLVRSVGRLPGAGTCMGAGAVCRETTRCWHLNGAGAVCRVITRCWHLHGGWCGL